MLRVGLTGGIGSGKSTVSARLGELGALVIDADVLAREVVEPGTDGLAAVTERFGAGVLTTAGALDRAALGRLVFGDDAARRDLEGILHPRIAARTAQLMADAPRDTVVVHDVPLLVEKSMGAAYHLVVVVGAGEQTRVERLARTRGMGPAEARARMAAQATDEQRRAAADVWLDNDGTPRALGTAVDILWDQRIEPYDAHLRARQVVRRPDVATIRPPDPAWAAEGARLAARLGRLLEDVATGVDHIGSTSVPGLPAKDVIDLQVGVPTLGVLDEAVLVDRLADGGFVLLPGLTADRGPGGVPWPKRVLGGCDPERVVQVHVREAGSSGWAWALRFRDWLRADPAARAEYAAFKAEVAARVTSTEGYAAAKEPWFAAADAQAAVWAAATGWRGEPGSR